MITRLGNRPTTSHAFSVYMRESYFIAYSPENLSVVCRMNEPGFNSTRDLAHTYMIYVSAKNSFAWDEEPASHENHFLRPASKNKVKTSNYFFLSLLPLSYPLHSHHGPPSPHHHINCREREEGNGNIRDEQNRGRQIALYS